MAFAIQDDVIGLPPIGASDITQKVPEGMICHAVDPVWGGGEFIYLKGVAGTVAGSLVSYDQVNHTTTLGPGAVANAGRPLAVATAANIAGQWGWYQISGAASVQKDGTALTAGAAVGAGAAAGQIGANSAGKQIVGANAVNAAAGGVATGVISMSRPFAQGAIT